MFRAKQILWTSLSLVHYSHNLQLCQYWDRNMTIELNPLQWRRYLTSSSICPASRVREEWFRKILLTADMQIAASFIWALRLECETFTAPSHNKHKDGLLRIVFRLGWYQCKIHKLELIADQSSALWCSPCNPFILVQKNRSYNLNKIT